jgi:hypothetical protein
LAVALSNPSAVEAEGPGDDLLIKAIPLGVACSMLEDNEDMCSATGTLTEEAEE